MRRVAVARLEHFTRAATVAVMTKASQQADPRGRETTGERPITRLPSAPRRGGPMLRTYQPGTSEMPAWAEVTAARPCPCCASAAGCSVVEEDGFVHCRTQVSAWP